MDDFCHAERHEDALCQCPQGAEEQAAAERAIFVLGLVLGIAATLGGLTLWRMW